MAYLDVPAGPTAGKIADILEAALLQEHGARAARRSGESTVHLSLSKDRLMPGWMVMLTSGPLAWMSRKTEDRAKLVEQAHARVTSTSIGWRVETGGNHLMHQYKMLLTLNEALFEHGLQSEVLRDRTRDRLLSE